MTISLVLDFAVAALLVATIVACWSVYRRLRTIRAGQDELTAQIDSFNQATARAEANLDRLREAAAEGGGKLEPLIAGARRLADDLDMLTHRADKTLARFDTLEPPPAAKPALAGRPSRSGRPPAKPPRSRSESELIAALGSEP